MGNLVIGGSGKGVPGLGTNWVIAIVLAIGLIILGFILANLFGIQQGWRGNVRTGLFYFFVVLGFIEAVVVIVVFALRNSTIQKTRVFVYENGINGMGVHPKFATDFFSPEKYATSTFSLTFEQISSVSTLGDTGAGLVINAQGKELMVITVNAKEIADVINGKILTKNSMTL